MKEVGEPSFCVSPADTVIRVDSTVATSVFRHIHAHKIETLTQSKRLTWLRRFARPQQPTLLLAHVCQDDPVQPYVLLQEHGIQDLHRCRRLPDCSPVECIKGVLQWTGDRQLHVTHTPDPSKALPVMPRRCEADCGPVLHTPGYGIRCDCCRKARAI